MKKIGLILLMFITAFIVSCEKDKENVMLKETIAANDLSNLTASTFVLLMDNAATTFQTFTWTEIDYGFNAVTKYDVMIDVKGNSFASPVNVLSVTDATTGSITVGAFNTILLNAGFEPEVAVDLQFRVKATINPNVAAVYSDIVEAKVTPYATVFPPIYMCGAAVGGWNWDLYTYKELKSTAPSIYETTAYFTNSGVESYFRFFKQANWNPTSWNYPYFTGTVSNLFEGQPDGDQNFRFIGTSGYYKVTVNMKTKSVAMVSVPEPVLFATGAALGGWNWDTDYIQLTWKADGIFQATTDFALETFRFFKQKGWGDGYNYPWFTTVSPLFVNALDGDLNFRFIGTPGSYTVTVNLTEKTVTMTQP